MKIQIALLEALELLERGDWKSAHAIVQQDESEFAAWLHGIVHVQEGDLGNARYWYARARRAFSADANTEITAARSVANGNVA
ncbi:hypothetical protein GCM10027277_04590 [Pseudoduganella ginsengisoli]|uniref:Tetratricopeptide repeat protein n=1 Tax=Pseudoduganella ginsengisoli TaxID=1462440 RepID=A0A6L6Q657_9BURK|nr:hypothetical protein [Pseudoduganella ginsengisoli]MTW04894.1 hypothetical protein [Pseudoduganella ginsengisoli]